MKGNKNADAIGVLRDDVQETRAHLQRVVDCHEQQVAWNHAMDLRVTGIEYRIGTWAFIGAIIGGGLLQLVMHFVFGL